MNFGDAVVDFVGIPVVRISFPSPVNAFCEEGAAAMLNENMRLLL